MTTATTATEIPQEEHVFRALFTLLWVLFMMSNKSAQQYRINILLLWWVRLSKAPRTTNSSHGNRIFVESNL